MKEFDPSSTALEPYQDYDYQPVYFVAKSFEDAKQKVKSVALWSRTAKNTDWSAGPLPGPFARSLAPLTRGNVNDWMGI